ncbi:MAG TPA: NAD(P)H-hydrate dehydratase [Candidatus Polarisedimenticolia bacterium]|jgi:NAD(P)H-hydrate epimerase|nr:NAD(P)H-hydrate dehydratase [Candidatus Polarisedimenticolia bacterium]
MKILDSRQTKSIDQRATRDYGIPGIVLMENAGLQIVDFLESRYDDLEDRGILILCGKGNNGGDGLVAARHLHNRGYDLQVLLFGRRSEIKGEPLTNLSILEKMSVEVREIVDVRAWHEFLPELARYDMVLDALLGTGARGGVKGYLEEVIRDVNNAAAERVAVDLPSGLSADSNEVPGQCVQADATVTFACPKIPLVFLPSEEKAGEVYVADIGIPEEAVDAEEVRLNLVEPGQLAHYLPPRKVESHKGDYGHLLVVAGSKGKPGAARMVAEGAFRAGVGLVTVATPESVQPILAPQVMEMMTEPLPETREGTVSTKAAARVLKLLDGKGVLTLGPGLSTAAETQSFIREIVSGTRLPLILDADGLNAYSAAPEQLSGKDRPLILTPHPGEMGRLLGTSSQEIQKDRIAVCQRFSTEHSCFLVLKGYRTLIADPEGNVWVNPTGNPGMATAGSGDVLTGILSGLVTQGIPILHAVLLGVYLHGLAADLCAEQRGELPLMARDLIAFLPDAMAHLLKGLDGEE